MSFNRTNTRAQYNHRIDSDDNLQIVDSAAIVTICSRPITSQLLSTDLLMLSSNNPSQWLSNEKSNWSSFGSSCSLSLLATKLSCLEDWSSSLLDVLFRWNTDHEGWDVNQLFSYGNVSLTDKNTSMMDAVSKLSLHDECLKSAFHELTNCETEDVIELSFGVFEESKSDHSADKSLTWSKLSYNHIK